MSKVSFDNRLMFTYESKSFPGVNKVAALVRQDLFLVTGFHAGEYTRGCKCRNLIIFGTVDRSDYLKELEDNGLLDLDEVRGRWEVYSFQVIDAPMEGVDHALVIAGSDKRGTIYGLFHLSELLGVSPLVNWNHVIPKKRKNVSLTDEVNVVTKEPSVRYRGFFINDEWPAFGNWAMEHFGGINAMCYERIFELLLRLKGNYLWPAMWNSNFSMDGPGLESARLADEYGVVMSTSHHEPCMRSGEEYRLLRGENSLYGDDWSFVNNRDGITRFWRDGLLRNKSFENVITLGMRGERDSKILGEDASLEDNIDLLRDVLKTQNDLIRETIDIDLDKVPRQIVLFSEVEEFFYGDDKTKGLMGDPELEGVTLMLSDNNVGYTRTLPSKEIADHPGGFGMYYHMDMHGGPYSFKWIGATYLPRVWEQMTAAYEFGVRQIWVVNVGDIGTQELGLSYFLDLAYDIEKWGGTDAAITQEYVDNWAERQFGAMLPLSGRNKIKKIIWDYTSLLEKRRHEIMNPYVYDPLHYGEADMVLATSNEILKEAAALKKKIQEQDMSAFISLLYYPSCGTANLMKMWILAGRNMFYASQNRVEANIVADELDVCVRADAEIIDEYETVDDGYYKGFGKSEHVGFINWNEEDNRYPVRHLVYGANSPRMLVARADDEHYMTGLEWCDKPQTWSNMLRPDVSSIQFDLISGSDKPFRYRIRTDCSWLNFSKTEGEVSVRERITLSVDKALLTDKATGTFTVESIGFGTAHVTVLVAPPKAPEGMFVESDGYICMEAEHFAESEDTSKGCFKVLKPYGRTGSAIKAFPVIHDFTGDKKKPSVTYRFYTRDEGDYDLTFDLAPTTPVTFKEGQYLSYSVNGGKIQTVNTVREPDKEFFFSKQWREEARDSVKKVSVSVKCKKGENTLKFYGASQGIVLERVLLVRSGIELPKSYLGPRESYIRLEDESSSES
ncbi:alpha-glucuronidase [Butyrivibrio sp. CB08]|uniref:glycosyl hydrolase 115 family protein n=1 Tax=Butyrivibrio sp. CB08 TaxID=2364879 RepID=UPI000EAA33ED|nr:glycosyl hydrolase 115 family protein [Butyrivibrio sp. CB08]RKM59941.1 alpha-glucuronidase [Butyrivibrio sp. CB08]